MLSYETSLSLGATFLFEIVVKMNRKSSHIYFVPFYDCVFLCILMFGQVVLFFLFPWIWIHFVYLQFKDIKAVTV